MFEILCRLDVVAQFAERQPEIIVQPGVLGTFLDRALKEFGRLFVIALTEMQTGNAGQRGRIVGLAFECSDVAFHRFLKVAG